jgi:hypothetical protein
MNAVLDAALGYAARGWPVFPCGNPDKRPLTAHGFYDATLDETQIRKWPWTAALVAIATGKPSGIVALDIDIREGGSGIDGLELLGINFHPRTATAHTPSGGIHVFFAWPGYEVPNSAGKIGPYLDVRGDGGYIILPPGPGRFWDPHQGPDTPLASMPKWMVIRDPSIVPPVGPSKPVGELNPYCETALDNAFRRIIEAPSGQQEETLNREAFGLGRLVGTCGMPPSLALEALQLAAARMPSFDRRRPWRPKEIERKIGAAFTAALRQPPERHHG